MEFIGKGVKPMAMITTDDAGLATAHGMVHNVRDMGVIEFIILRGGAGIVQCVRQKAEGDQAVHPGDSLEITGTLMPDERAPGGQELHVQTVKILSRAAELPPVDLARGKMNLTLDTLLELRPVTLRNLRERAVFKLQEGLVRGFRDFLHTQGFTEVRTPKIVSAGAEGGANIFRLDYFGRKAFLAQSPQFYKQMMVGVYERVFEVAPVFRAEKHATARHLNEYTSMDFEMGFIDSFHDIMQMEAAMLRHTLDLLKKEYAPQLKLWDVQLPDTDKISVVRFDEAKQMAAEKYDRPIRDPFDLEPEEEHNIGKLFQEEYGSDFVFVTHYPSKKRPFYAMDDPQDPRYTLSFDLLLRGTEITTGGQRVHDYTQQVEKMQARGMDPQEFGDYLMIHKHGMPPHGGLGIGLERLTMKLLGLDNVRKATMFPRDIRRLTP